MQCKGEFLSNSKIHRRKKKGRLLFARNAHITAAEPLCMGPKIESTISPDRVDSTESRVSLN